MTELLKAHAFYKEWAESAYRFLVSVEYFYSKPEHFAEARDLIAQWAMQQKVESMDHEYKGIPKMNLGPGAEVMFRSITGDCCDQIEINPSGSVATKEIYLQVQDTKTMLWSNADKVDAGNTWRIMMRDEALKTK